MKIAVAGGGVAGCVIALYLTGKDCEAALYNADSG
jgi:glycine/D-amino acid oxidase-like deaminating enzyme